ncbi:MAG: ribbon-helix-helix domain-containing protein [Rhodospirillales bacterium]|nr:ribbon-helix-helix domain-containing protein [Rhodospirillales bacterium]
MESKTDESVIKFYMPKTTLLSRNITINRHRTSVRLEPQMWDALKDVANREGCSIHDVCTLVHLRKTPETSLTAAIRVFLLLYYRIAATEEGHQRVGHGNFETMKIRAGIKESEDSSLSLSRQKTESDSRRLSFRKRA